MVIDADQARERRLKPWFQACTEVGPGENLVSWCLLPEVGFKHKCHTLALWVASSLLGLVQPRV